MNSSSCLVSNLSSWRKSIAASSRQLLLFILLLFNFLLLKSPRHHRIPFLPILRKKLPLRCQVIQPFIIKRSIKYIRIISSIRTYFLVSPSPNSSYPLPLLHLPPRNLNWHLPYSITPVPQVPQNSLVNFTPDPLSDSCFFKPSSPFVHDIDFRGSLVVIPDAPPVNLRQFYYPRAQSSANAQPCHIGE